MTEEVQEVAEATDQGVQATQEPPMEASVGDRPEWLLEKYKSTDDQAKAYVELQKKFGSFTGAPESYEVSVPDEMKEAGFDVDPSDPIIGELQKFAKESNMSQEGFSGLVEMAGKWQLAQAQWQEDHRQNEMKALGDKAQSRVEAIAKWGKANLDSETFQGLEDAAVSASAIRAIEALIAKTRNAPQVGKDASAAPAISRTDWESKRFAKNEHGRLRYNDDPHYRKEVDQMRDALFGTEEHRMIIGG